MYLSPYSSHIPPIFTHIHSGPSGLEADGPSFNPSISADGRYIAFESDAYNLLGPGNDTNGARDIFVYDTLLDETVRVSVSSLGVEADGPSYAPSISANGRFVAFHSSATNLVFGFTTAGQGGLSNIDVFVHDRDANGLGIYGSPGNIWTYIISHAQGLEANGDSTFASISANGRYVSFQSLASNLVTSDGNSVSDIFVRNVVTDEIIRASVDEMGGDSDGASITSAISDDGRFISFASDAEDLVDPDGGGYTDIFFRDRGVRCLGDLNGDHVVDINDVKIVIQNYGDCVCCAADLDGDGIVYFDDRAILISNMGPCW